MIDWKKSYNEMYLSMMECSQEQKGIYEKVCRDLVINNFPKNLYKYGHFDNDYWQEIILGEVFFQHPSEWNDLFDSACLFDYESLKRDIQAFFQDNNIDLDMDLLIAKIISKKKSDIFVLNEFFNNMVQLNKEFLEAMCELIEKIEFSITFTHRLKASCFSEEYDNMKMWYYYAKEYTGFCVDFDFSRQRDGNIKPVIYTDKRFTAKNNSYPFFETELFLPMLLKNTCWSDEKEWRFIYPNKLTDSKQTITNCPVKAIYFGNKTSDTNMGLALKLLKDTKNQMPKIYKMVANKYTNKFAPEEITVF